MERRRSEHEHDDDHEKIRIRAVTCLAAVVWAGLCHGVTYTWTGASNSTWMLNNNWSPATSYPKAISDTAVFNGAGNNNTNVTVGNVSIGNYGVYGVIFDTSRAVGFGLTGGAISAAAGVGAAANVMMTPSVLKDQVVMADVIMHTGGGFRNNSPTASLTMAGNLSLMPTHNTNAVSFSGIGDTLVSGSLTDGAAPTNRPYLYVIRHGRTTLTGANTFTGVAFGNYGVRRANVVVGYGGTLVLDYSSNPTVLPSGTVVAVNGWYELLSGNYGTGGTLMFKGKSTGATTQTLGTLYCGRGQANVVVDPNGGAGTTVIVSNLFTVTTANNIGEGLFLFDLSAGGAVQLSSNTVSGGDLTMVNNNLIQTGTRYAGVLVKDTSSKTYFATVNEVNSNIVAQTGLSALPASGGNSKTNYLLTGNQTMTADQMIQTLRIEPSTSGQALNLGGNKLTIGKCAILLDGSQDFEITNGRVASETLVYVAGPGTLKFSAVLTNNVALNKFGPGLLEVTGDNSTVTNDTFIYNGVLRAGSESVFPCRNLYLQGGVLELGYDFTRSLGTNSPGGVVFYNGMSSGFSAYGGNHFVNIGGAGATLTWLANTATFWTNFLASRDCKLLLSSPYSDSTIDFQNPLNLNAEYQTVDVANGSALKDAILSGSLTNGGLTKLGSGTLELTANNGYTLGTVISAGTLLVDNASGSGTGTGLVTVCSGATLGGSGVIVSGGTNDVSIEGTVAPGAGVAPEVAGTTFTISLPANSNRVVMGNAAKFTFKCSSAAQDKVRFLNFGAGEMVLGASNVVISVTDVGGLQTGSYTLMEFYSDGGTTLTDTGKPVSGFVLGNDLPANLAKSSLDYSQTGKIILQARAQTGTLFSIF